MKFYGSHLCPELDRFFEYIHASFSRSRIKSGYIDRIQALFRRKADYIQFMLYQFPGNPLHIPVIHVIQMEMWIAGIELDGPCLQPL